MVANDNENFKRSADFLRLLADILSAGEQGLMDARKAVRPNWTGVPGDYDPEEDAEEQLG